MSATQKIVIGALLAVGALCLIVGFTLMHYIGGFLRTVEEEAKEEEQAARKPTDAEAPQTEQAEPTSK